MRLRCPHCGRSLAEKKKPKLKPTQHPDLAAIRARKRAMLQASGHTLRARLTPPEQKVIECIFRGLPNEEIAEETGRPLQVVKNRIRFAFRKLGVTSRLDLLVKSLKHGGYNLWTYSGERYQARKYETAEEKRAAELRNKSRGDAGASVGS